MQHLHLQAEQQQKQLNMMPGRTCVDGKAGFSRQDVYVTSHNTLLVPAPVFVQLRKKKCKARQTERTKEVTVVRRRSDTVRHMSREAVPVCDTPS